MVYIPARYNAFTPKSNVPGSLSSTSLPKKPSPAVGASAPTNNSFTSTTGLPFDPMTGLSYRQLTTARDEISRVFQLAAQGANVSLGEGPEVFGKTANYMDINNIILGLTQNNQALAGRVIDRMAADLVDLSQLRGEAWFTLTYFMFTVDSYMSSATFFLGHLTSEEFSALEDIFLFYNLLTYGFYHQYQTGIRRRPIKLCR